MLILHSFICIVYAKHCQWNIPLPPSQGGFRLMSSRPFAIAQDDNWQGGEKETSIPPLRIQQEMDELAATLGPHEVDFGHDHAVLEGALVRASLG